MKSTPLILTFNFSIFLNERCANSCLFKRARGPNHPKCGEFRLKESNFTACEPLKVRTWRPLFVIFFSKNVVRKEFSRRLWRGESIIIGLSRAVVIVCRWQILPAPGSQLVPFIHFHRLSGARFNAPIIRRPFISGNKRK